MALPDVAEYVAEYEVDVPFHEIPADQIMNLYLTIYHQHVPRLADEDVVRYDQDRDLISLSDDVDEIIRILSQLPQAESQ